MTENLRRIIWTALSIVFLSAVLVAAFGGLVLPLRGLFPAYYLLLLLLYCFVPQGLLLRALKVRSHAVWIGIGVLSGWLTLILGNLSWFHAMAPTRSLGELPSRIFANDASAGDFAKLAFAGLLMTGGVAGLIAWLWRLRSDPATPVDEGNPTPRGVPLPPLGWP